jgi:hypothetical protein
MRDRELYARILGVERPWQVAEVELEAESVEVFIESAARRMVKRYDPLMAPDPKRWLASDEGERQRLVEQYHRRQRVRLPNLRAHAAVHVVVENQVAMGDELPVAETLARLITEGLDRHEAIHAIGNVLAVYLYDLLKAPAPPPDPNPEYFAALKRLTAQAWRAG